MRRQRMLAEVTCISVVLALLLLIDHCAASPNALDHQCIHDTEKIQTLIYGSLDATTKQRQAFTTEGIQERTAAQEYLTNPLMANIRIVTSILDLETAGKYCTAAGGKVPDFMGGTEITCTADDIFTDAKKTILMEKVLPEALMMLSSALKVNQVQGNLKAPGCQYYTVPELHKTTGVSDADYVLYVSAAPIAGTAKSTVAWAGHCSIDQHRRPVNGRANFNPRDLVWDDSDPNAQRQLVRTAVHQILHALGFSSSLWANPSNGLSPIKEETRREKKVKYLSSSSVVAKAKTYFGCQSMEGPELEDEGDIVSVGSHWKRRTHMDDMMTGITGVWMYLSPITLAVMEDSGHYTVDWSKAEDPKWMYKAGCGVIDAKCDTDTGGKGKYFCFDSTDVGCAPDHRSFGVCSSMSGSAFPLWAKYKGDWGRITGTQPFMDYCPIIQGRSQNQCDNPLVMIRSTPKFPRYHGRDGRCFKSHVKKIVSGSDEDSGYIIPASCLQTTCVNNVVYFKFPDIQAWITCPRGTTVTLKDGYVGHVVCPEPNIVCDGIEAPALTPPTTIIPPPIRANPTGIISPTTKTKENEIVVQSHKEKESRETEVKLPKPEPKPVPPVEGSATGGDGSPSVKPATDVNLPEKGPSKPSSAGPKPNDPTPSTGHPITPGTPKADKPNPTIVKQLPKEPKPIKPKAGDTKVSVTVPPRKTNLKKEKGH